ncbi:MAG: lectin [bacterium]|nr:lectin [bacterium]
MKQSYYYLIGAAAILILAGIWYFSAMPGAQPQQANQQNQQSQGNDQASPMSFFVTSKNPGRGGDLGGLSGADNYCKTLAASAGAGDKVWRAYLSTQSTSNTPAVNARDRIGNGPWSNAKSVVIASNLNELHNDNNINKQTALDEKGNQVNGRGDTPNWHDILTGSDPGGRAIATSTDMTCDNWTEDRRGGAMVGHHDRLGLRDDAPSRSWNSSHLTRGCSLEELATTGSGGLFYCFALNE